MRRLTKAGLAAAAVTLAAAPAGHPARSLEPHIWWVTCWPRSCGTASPRVNPGARLLIAVSGLLRGSVHAEFPVRGRRHRVRAMVAHRRSAHRLLLRVPADAVSGRVRIRVRRGPRSNFSRFLRIVPRSPTRPSAGLPTGSGTAFDGNGMWIWVLSRSEGGDVPAIAARARASGIRTVFLKSSDGAGFWPQFSASTLQTLKAAGLKVCAWQYVYGSDPHGEAAVGARAAQAGADCLVIDAESEYEGRYAQAQTYVSALRAAVGPSYPIGLAGFPYVDYHPSFPFSVFLGPAGAQFNLPQMYWRAIGTSVDAVYVHTWPVNRVYGRPILPLGQTYQDPAPAELARFRQLALGYGAAGLSWWDWQETTARGWGALAAPVTAFTGAAPAAASAWPTLSSGSKGDLVVWAQEHLKGAGQSLAVDGSYGSGTAAAVRSFQAANGLPASGAVDAATWPALLRAPVAAQNWAARAAARASVAGTKTGRTGPPSAGLPARAEEIPPVGRGSGEGP